MPIHKHQPRPEYMAECDVCGEAEPDYEPANDQEQYEGWLLRWGWRKRDGKWLCPRCGLSRGKETGDE